MPAAAARRWLCEAGARSAAELLSGPLARAAPTHGCPPASPCAGRAPRAWELPAKRPRPPPAPPPRAPAHTPTPQPTRPPPAPAPNPPQVLGNGTYGVVRTATHRATGEQFAVKILQRRRNKADRTAIIENEVRLLKQKKPARLFPLAAGLLIVLALCAAGAARPPQRLPAWLGPWRISAAPDPTPTPASKPSGGHGRPRPVVPLGRAHARGLYRHLLDLHSAGAARRRQPAGAARRAGRAGRARGRRRAARRARCARGVPRGGHLLRRCAAALLRSRAGTRARRARFAPRPALLAARAPPAPASQPTTNKPSPIPSPLSKQPPQT